MGRQPPPPLWAMPERKRFFPLMSSLRRLWGHKTYLCILETELCWRVLGRLRRGRSPRHFSSFSLFSSTPPDLRYLCLNPTPSPTACISNCARPLLGERQQRRGVQEEEEEEISAAQKILKSFNSPSLSQIWIRPPQKAAPPKRHLGCVAFLIWSWSSASAARFSQAVGCVAILSRCHQHQQFSRNTPTPITQMIFGTQSRADAEKKLPQGLA